MWACSTVTKYAQVLQPSVTMTSWTASCALFRGAKLWYLFFWQQCNVFVWIFVKEEKAQKSSAAQWSALLSGHLDDQWASGG